MTAVVYRIVELDHDGRRRKVSGPRFLNVGALDHSFRQLLQDCKVVEIYIRSVRHPPNDEPPRRFARPRPVVPRWRG